MSALRALFLLVATASATAAFAGGKASPKPPAPPDVSLAALPPSAVAQRKEVDGKDHPVRVHLIADHLSVAPGGSLRVGALLVQQQGWHTYWKYNADIGLPTDIKWTLPAGFTGGAYQYPTPQRFEDSGIISFGYEDQVLLFTEIDVPTDAPIGAHTVNATMSWLVCESTCIPGQADVSVGFDVATDAETSSFNALFDHYAAQHPTPVAEAPVAIRGAASVDAVRPNSTFRARFLVEAPQGKTLAANTDASAAPWPTFTPIGGLNWMVDKIAVAELPAGEVAPNGGVVVTIDGTAFAPDELPTDDVVGGLFQVSVDGVLVQTELTISLPWRDDGAPVASTDPLWSLALAGDAAVPPARDDSTATDATATDVETAAPVTLAPATIDTSLSGLAFNLLFAFIGGLLLNIMPCVLPVLTLKLYSLVEQADIQPSERRMAGFAYTGGILVSFFALAAVVIVLRTAFGIEVDWGFQFQFPPYVAGLTTLIFIFGLSLFGVFEIPAFGVDAANEAGSKSGFAGYFSTGVFATLVATPCSAPFLGSAVAFAFGAPAVVLLAVFLMVGLGLAAPFLLIAMVPALYRFLPRPGAWMETFKQLLGFSLIATAVWLVSVLMAQIGPDRTIWFITFLLVTSLAAWIFGRFGGLAETRGRQLGAAAVAGLLTFAGGYWLLDLQLDDAPVCDDAPTLRAADLDFTGKMPWQPFSDDRVAALAGQPVFVDFTADWCFSCKVNERTVLESASVRAGMAAHGVVPLKADWTRRDDTITAWLHRYGRAGVPFYLMIHADGTATPLGEIVTPGQLLAAFEAAK